MKCFFSVWGKINKYCVANINHNIRIYWALSCKMCLRAGANAKKVLFYFFRLCRNLLQQEADGKLNVLKFPEGNVVYGQGLQEQHSKLYEKHNDCKNMQFIDKHRWMKLFISVDKNYTFKLSPSL